MTTEWADKRVLVTGVCGTVGGEILSQLLHRGAAEVLGVDNNESELFLLDQRYSSSSTRPHLRLGDVRDPSTLHGAFEDVDIVLHAAAFKHVYLCEQSPNDAIRTNVLGVQNVIDAAEARGVERVVFTSSDKAVNPTSVMGTSKLLGERLFTAADTRRRRDRPVFSSTRFGNVLGSRGSVIPLFAEQIRQGGPVTLTDPGMTRFIMTLEEAVALVMDSVFMARGGEVFVTKMPVVRIEDLATIMIEELAPAAGYEPRDIDIEIIGAKPGEKMYEELLNEEEIRRAVELSRYFVVQPAVRPVFREPPAAYSEPVVGSVERAYNSSGEAPMDSEALRLYLRERGLIEPAPVTT